MNLIAAIQSFVPGCAQEAADQDLILSLALREPIAILTRESLAAHMTASRFIVNEARNKTLMVHHNIYNSWSWTGGHADGDSDLLAVALREAREETGIVNVTPLSREIMSLDVLTVPGTSRMECMCRRICICRRPICSWRRKNSRSLCSLTKTAASNGSRLTVWSVCVMRRICCLFIGS